MDCKKFTIFLKFEVRLIRLVIFRNCSLQKLLEYAGNKFGILNALLTAKDSYGKFITDESFSRMLLNQRIKCGTFRIQTKTPEVRPRSEIKFKGYLRLLNQGRIRSSIQRRVVKENISIKAKTVFRQNCFIGVVPHSEKRNINLQKSSALFRQSSFIDVESSRKIQQNSATIAATAVSRSNSFMDVESSGRLESLSVSTKNSAFVAKGSSAVKRRKITHDRVKTLRI